MYIVSDAAFEFDCYLTDSGSYALFFPFFLFILFFFL